MTTAPHSAIVVGAGVFGCACAYYLAKSGVAVTVIERDRFGAHASSNNPGNINPIHGAPPALIPLALEAFSLHRVLLAELTALGCAAYDWRPVRRVLLALDESDMQHLHLAQLAFADRAGFNATRLGGAAVAALDARLSGGIEAGLLVEGNMSLDSGRFHHALAEAAGKLGAIFVRGKVSGLIEENGNAVGLRTSEGEFAADAFVFATGAWTAPWDKQLGMTLPVSPVKGEMLALDLPGPPLGYDFTHGMVSLYRRGERECWIGVTKDNAGFDETPSEAVRLRLIEAASRIMPAVASAPVLAHTAALRPMSADGLPLAGRVPGRDNCFVANGGGIKGMLLCSAIGQGIAQLMINGSSALPFPPLARE